MAPSSKRYKVEKFDVGLRFNMWKIKINVPWIYKVYEKNLRIIYTRYEEGWWGRCEGMSFKYDFHSTINNIMRGYLWN